MSKTVEMQTSAGTMKIELDDERAPLSAQNFLDFTAESAQGWGYAVFGRVVDGTEVVDAIEQVRTGTKAGHADVPLETVTIHRAVEVG